MTGNVFNELINNCDKEQMNIIMENTYVYARMKPNDKGNLVRALKRSAWNLVSFTGDGTNDTCALRNADVGLALSDEDASLAAPFTSLVFHIEPLITLLKEGRASLVTSIECFKFMTLYSVI
jgi:cation-transporting ATPase 13A3/4/5